MRSNLFSLIFVSFVFLTVIDEKVSVRCDQVVQGNPPNVPPLKTNVVIPNNDPNLKNVNNPQTTVQGNVKTNGKGDLDGKSKNDQTDKDDYLEDLGEDEDEIECSKAFLTSTAANPGAVDQLVCQTDGTPSLKYKCTADQCDDDLDNAPTCSNCNEFYTLPNNPNAITNQTLVASVECSSSYYFPTAGEKDQTKLCITDEKKSYKCHGECQGQKICQGCQLTK